MTTTTTMMINQKKIKNTKIKKTQRRGENSREKCDVVSHVISAYKPNEIKIETENEGEKKKKRKEKEA